MTGSEDSKSLDLGFEINSVPAPVRWIVRTLEDAGYETWAVGGAVRDHLLGISSVDWDLATRADPAAVRRLFRRTVPIGIEHGTVGVLARDGTLYEVTTFRRDIETDGRHAKVRFAETIEDDLARRDFTINAIAWHPLQSRLCDPYDGAGDLRARVLRTVGRPEERFKEDYLRVLRALRFAGRFDLRIEPKTWLAIEEAVPEIHRLSPERVREEITKVVEADPRPSTALGLWATSGALAQVSPELEQLRGEWGGASEPSLWDRALAAVDRIPRHHPWARWTALVMSLGRPFPEAEDSGSEVEGVSPRFARLGLSTMGRARTLAWMSRLRFSNAAIDRVAGNALGGDQPPPPHWPRPELRRWLSVVGPDRLADVVRAWGGLATWREEQGQPGGRDAVAATARRLRREVKEKQALRVRDLRLDGRDLIQLGLKPGPQFGQILEVLLDRVFDDPGLNRREALIALVKEMETGE